MLLSFADGVRDEYNATVRKYEVAINNVLAGTGSVAAAKKLEAKKDNLYRTILNLEKRRI